MMSLFEMWTRIRCAWLCLNNKSIMLNMVVYNDGIAAKKSPVNIVDNDLKFGTSIKNHLGGNYLGIDLNGTINIDTTNDPILQHNNISQ